ncbi:MAG: hypothetical protein P4L84_36175 [Isosphaeraceae bacterium]|nr:hypothetical protein [Isosphaeraceae bacterium]
MKPMMALCMLAISTAVCGGTHASDRAETVVLRGKVVELAAALKADGLVYDAEPVTKQVVLQTAGGEVVPLISDDASRALFHDKRLRDRPAELHARRFQGLPYVQVVTFRVEEDGRMRTPEYYCEICTISVRYPQICPCCQGEMVLRMKPEPR